MIQSTNRFRMLLLFFWAIIASGALLAQSGPITATDTMGRQITINRPIRKVYCTGPVGAIFIYTLAPDRLAGWNYPLGDAEKKFILPQYQSLPVMGGWFGQGQTGNVEEILRNHPDLILAMGDMDNMEMQIDLRLQEQTHIPVYLQKGGFSNFAQAYRVLGRLLGAAERGSQLAAYCDEVLRKAQQWKAQIPASQQPRVYYAEGPRGLETDPSGSPHTELLDLLGAINVAQVPLQSGYTGYGRNPVSLEQVFKWDPDLILVGADHYLQFPAFLAQIEQDPLWGRLRAVRNHAVYLTPQPPFNWFDRPPSVSRLIGIYWLASLLYPKVVQLDIREEVRRYYHLFYQRDLSPNEVSQLLERAMPAPPPPLLRQKK